MKVKLLILWAVILQLTAIGQSKNAFRAGFTGGITPYESSLGVGAWGAYGRTFSTYFELFASAHVVTGSYTTTLPNYSYENTERVLALDFGGNLNLSPEKEHNRLLIGLGVSWVQVDYNYGERVFSDRVEMNRVDPSIAMLLLRIEEQFFFSDTFFVSAHLSGRTCFSEQQTVERSITASGNVGVTGGVRYFVNIGLGIGYAL